MTTVVMLVVYYTVLVIRLWIVSESGSTTSGSSSKRPRIDQLPTANLDADDPLDDDDVSLDSVLAICCSHDDVWSIINWTNRWVSKVCEGINVYVNEWIYQSVSQWMLAIMVGFCHGKKYFWRKYILAKTYYCRQKLFFASPVLPWKKIGCFHRLA